MKTFAILLGFVFLCSSLAFAVVNDVVMTDTDYWAGKWCTGWSSGDSPQVGCPIQLNLEKKGETLTGDDTHFDKNKNADIITNYNKIKVTRDESGKLHMNGSWNQGTAHEGIFNVTLNNTPLTSFNGTWKDTIPPYDYGNFWGIALDECPNDECPAAGKHCPF